MTKAQIIWEDVDSSNVSRVAYEPESQTLCVQFKSGGLYSYSGVDVNTYFGLVGADSVGQYLNQVVKVMYPYTKFETEADLVASI